MLVYNLWVVKKDFRQIPIRKDCDRVYYESSLDDDDKYSTANLTEDDLLPAIKEIFIDSWNVLYIRVEEA